MESTETFDELLLKKDKQVARQNKKPSEYFIIKKLIQYKNKLAKKYQIKSKIRGLNHELKITKIKFNESLTDPYTDSVDLKIYITKIEAQLKQTKELYAQLFHSNIRKFFTSFKKTK